MESQHFDVHGVQITVKSDLDDFRRFINENYKTFVTSTNPSQDIDMEFSVRAGRMAEQKTRDLATIGNQVYFEPNLLAWKNEFGFCGYVKRTESMLRIRAFHQELAEDQSPEERYKNLQRCMRWTMHYPLFTALQYDRGWNLIHGSAVTDGERTIAFCGLNKVGKSTLATYFCREHGFNLLTDNFLLAGTDRIYSFPEVLRLNEKSVSRFDLDPIWDHLVYDKAHVSPTQLGIASDGTPDAFFLLSRGEQLRLRDINPKVAWQVMNHLHSMLGEFPEYHYMSLWPLVTGSTRTPIDSKMPIFNTPWFSLTHELNWELSDVTAKVMECI